ncbi:MAG: MFS transporter [Candidatus Hodarchaeales archaeon]
MDTIVIRYIILYLIGNAYTYIIAGFSTIYFLGFIDIFNLGFILSLYTLIQFLLEYPTGSLTDTFGVRSVYISGTIIFSLSLLIQSLMHSQIELLVSVIIAGIGTSLRSGCLVTWFNNTYREKYKDNPQKINSMNKIYGRVGTLSTVSISLSVAAGGSLAVIAGMNTVYFIAFSISLLMAMTIFVILPKENLSKKSGTTSLEGYMFNLRNGFSNFIKKKPLVRYSVFYSIFYAILASFITIILQPALQSKGMTVELISFLISGGIIFMAGGTWFNNAIKRVINRFSDEDTVVLAITGLLQTISLFLFLLGIVMSSISVLVLATMMFYLFWGAFGPIFSECFQKQITSNYRARFLSIHYTLTSLSLTAGYTLVGVLVTISGYTNFIPILIVLIIILVTWFLTTNINQDSAESILLVTN